MGSSSSSKLWLLWWLIEHQKGDVLRANIEKWWPEDDERWDAPEEQGRRRKTYSLTNMLWWERIWIKERQNKSKSPLIENSMMDFATPFSSKSSHYKLLIFQSLRKVSMIWQYSFLKIRKCVTENKIPARGKHTNNSKIHSKKPSEKNFLPFLLMNY